MVGLLRSCGCRAALLAALFLSFIVLEGCASVQLASAAPRKHKHNKKKRHLRPSTPEAQLRSDLDELDAGDDDGDGVEDEDLDEGEDDPALTAVILAEGGASFYHDTLAGRLTANGERYNPEAQTCAHKSLPFGTVLLIEDLKTGKTTHCRVNDRGPFVTGRVVDLSRRVARDLGILERGITRVRLRVARPPTTS